MKEVLPKDVQLTLNRAQTFILVQFQRLQMSNYYGMYRPGLPRIKDKPSELFLKPSELGSCQRTLENQRPPTPNPFDKTGKRPVTSSPHDMDGFGGDAKKRKVFRNQEIIESSPRLNISSLNSAFPHNCLPYNVSSAELLKAWQSILKQVDWSKVVLDVVGTDRPAHYQDIFEKILQSEMKRSLDEIGRHEEMFTTGFTQDREYHHVAEHVVNNNNNNNEYEDLHDDSVVKSDEEEAEYEWGPFVDEHDDGQHEVSV